MDSNRRLYALNTHTQDATELQAHMLIVRVNPHISTRSTSGQAKDVRTRPPGVRSCSSSGRPDFTRRRPPPADQKRPDGQQASPPIVRGPADINGQIPLSRTLMATCSKALNEYSRSSAFEGKYSALGTRHSFLRLIHLRIPLLH